MCTYPIACYLCEDDPCTMDGEEKWKKFSHSWKWVNESMFNVYSKILIPMSCLGVLEEQTSVPSSSENSCLFPKACHYEELWIFWMKSQSKRYWGHLQYRCPFCTKHGHLYLSIAAVFLWVILLATMFKLQHRTLLYLTQRLTLGDLTWYSGFSRKISSC